MENISSMGLEQRKNMLDLNIGKSYCFCMPLYLVICICLCCCLAR
jgi:hypothetical protein